MSPLRRLTRNTSGWTLMELIIVVAIMSILLSLATASYDSIKAKVRFSQVKADFDVITHAAVFDFTSNQNHDWAPMVMPGDPPIFVGQANGNLPKWPSPPCPGWIYSWDNFYGVPGVQAVRLTLRRGDLTSIWSFCLENYSGNCQGDDGFGGNPPELSEVSHRYIYCNE